MELDKQAVIPTHKDLVESKKLGLPILKLNPYAVFVKKISSKQKAALMAKSQIDSNKSIIKALCKEFDYEFLVDFQFADNTILSDEDMYFMESIQRVPELKTLCMLEKSPNQTSETLETQIKDWKKRNLEKELIVVSEVYTSDIIKKIGVAKANGVKKYIIKFRSYEKHKAKLSKFLANLNIAGIDSVVFGTFPTKHKKTNATMFLPPLYFGAGAVASWIAWGGGKSPLMFLCADWKFKVHDKADEGLMDYSGKSRSQLISERANINTKLQKIDTLNQVNLMLKKRVKLTEVQFKALFN